jgi:AraC-like DNA-binding protein
VEDLTLVNFAARLSDIPFVEGIYQARSTGTGTFTSVAATQWEMVVTKQYGHATLTVRGPETKARPADIPADAEFFGIVFRVGTFMPHLPTSELVDLELNLPDASRNTVWLHGSAWEMPTYDNADTFIQRLIRQDMLTREPIVEAILKGHLREDLSLRSVQRRFAHATGLSHNTIYQIERAKRAASLLEQGVAILDTVEIAGYADQPHLTRAVRRWIGQTPTQIQAARQFQLVGFGDLG